MKLFKEEQTLKIYIILLAIFLDTITCSTSMESSIKKNDLTVGKKQSSGEPNLVIEWYGKKIDLDEVNIKLSHKFPLVKTEYTLTPGVILPIEPAVRIPLPIIKNEIAYSFQETIQDGSRLEYDLTEGDYFISIDTEGYKEFRWDSSENKRIVASFGFRHNDQSIEMKNLEYNGDCVSKYGGFYGSPKISYSYCKKVKIVKGKQTAIKINFSELKSSDLGIFPKFFPGIILLAPFNNKDGLYYSYRDYTIELIEPEETSAPESPTKAKGK